MKRLYLFFILLLSVTNVFGQVDTEFWFAAPWMSQHCNYYQDIATLHLRIFAYESDANVLVSMPADASFTPISRNISAGGFTDITLATDYASSMSNIYVPFDKVSKRGFFISSDAPIGCYYQITGANGEAFTLKGHNALGTDFVVAMQAGRENASGYSDALSNVQIVATEDGTVVTISPTKPCGASCSTSTFSISLNRGETYAVKACSQIATQHIIGTMIHSNKPIAVTSNDDSVVGGGCDDVGEQLIPNDLLGNEYVAISAKQTDDYCYIIAIHDKTTIKLSNGAQYTLNKGQYAEVSLTSSDVMYFSGNQPFALFQKTGHNGEVGGTILPQLLCTGSTNASYVRIPNSSVCKLHLLTKANNTSNLTINGTPISSGQFSSVPGTNGEWSFAKIDVSSYSATNPIVVHSSNGIFQMSVIDYQSTSGTCTVGYFSDYNNIHEYDDYATISGFETYTWHGHKTPEGQDMVFTKDGIYKDQNQDVYGCDSTHVLHLSVIPYPDNVDAVTCKFEPEAVSFEMKELYRVNGAHSMSTSLVADMDGDGITEIISPNYGSLFCSNQLKVIDGRNGKIKYTISTSTFNICGQAMTIADIDEDGKCEVMLQANDKCVYCYSYNGTLRWKSSLSLDNIYIPLLFKNKGSNIPLLIFGRYIFNPQSGQLLHTISLTATGMGKALPCGNTGSMYGERMYYMGAAADINQDGYVEYCAGNTVYQLNITNYSSSQGNSSTILCQAEQISQVVQYDGQTFVVDFDNDGDMDVCVLAIPNSFNPNQSCIYVYVWDGQTNKIIAYSGAIQSGRDAQGGTGPSIPYCGDINGDGYSEITFGIKGKSMLSYVYDAKITGHMRQLHNYSPFNESCGFTVFDFNKDGNAEIVYRGSDKLSIIDGTTLAEICTPVRMSSATITEYPVIADVNGDGCAELIVNRNYENGSHEGWTSVYGAAVQGTWSSARPVWNQWAYNSVNINDDMTVPQYQYDVSTKFPNGKRPFNSFLAQSSLIDTVGNIYVPAADVLVTSAQAQVANDMIEVTLSICNNGKANLVAPYEITTYQNTYHGLIMHVDTIKEDLTVNACKTITLKVPALKVCNVARDTAFVVAVNDDGHGIAQNGNQQAECDTTNNIISVRVPSGLPRDTTYISRAVSKGGSYTFDGKVYTTDTTVVASFIGKDGCDSVCVLNLTVIPYPDNILEDVGCTWAEDAEDWTIKSEWSSEVSMSPLVIPLVGDVNDDGKTEFICFAANDQFNFFGVNKVVVFSGSSHQIIQTFTVAGRVSAQDAGVYGLVKLSNRHTLLVCYTVDRKMYAYDLSADVSKPLWQTSIPYDAVNISFTDFNGDGNPEIYLGSYIYDAATGSLLAFSNSSNSGTALAHNNDGTFNPRVELKAPMVADMDDDGLPELILGTQIYKVQITNNNGLSGNTMTLFKSIAAPSGLVSDGHTQVADFNLDGHLDVFISGCQSNGVFFYIWDAYNNFVSQPVFLSRGEDAVGKSIPLIADINVDGIPEVLIQARFDIGNNRFVRAYQYHIASKSFTLLWDLDVDEDSFSNSMTMFDFDHNGTNEIVVTDQSRVRILDHKGNVLSSFKYGECTVMQYPIIADVDDDGSAEILVIGQANMGHSYKGSVNIFTSAGKPWVAARSVWNQYMYNQTNVNNDLTIPDHLYNNAQVFSTADGKPIRPYNNFLQQATIIDEFGNPINPVPDAEVQSANATLSGDSVLISLSFCNNGDANLVAPYEITTYQNTYHGLIMHVDTIKEDLTVNACKTITLKVPALKVCNVARDTAFVVAVNDDGHGIAQNGNQQAECDTTNNITIVQIPRGLRRDTTFVKETICETELPYTHPSTGIVFPVGAKGIVDSVVLLATKDGCDSIVNVRLSVLQRPQLIVRQDTIAQQGDSVLLWAKGADIFQWQSLERVSQSLTHEYFAHPTKSAIYYVFGYPAPLNTACVTIDSVLIYVMKMQTEKHHKCASDLPYQWNSLNISQFGTFRDTLFSSTGYRDSIAVLIVNELFPTDSIENATICAGDSYMWHGQLFTKTTKQVDTLVNAVGCDSVCTLNLVVRPAIVGDTMASFCSNEPFTWYGTTYTKKGDYTHTLVSKATGCDSVVTLHLSVLQPTDSIENVTICERLSYTWHGRTFTTSTKQTETLTNAAGCDSVCTLNLTFVDCCPKVQYQNETKTICDTLIPCTWHTWRDVTIPQVGNYSDTLRNWLGCDSIIYAIDLNSYHCCAPMRAKLAVENICADAATMNVTIDLLGGELNEYDLHFINPASNSMPFRDTTVFLSTQYASSSPIDLIIPIPRNGNNKTKYPRPDDNYQINLTLHDVCGQSKTFSSNLFSVYYPSWVIEQHWDDLIAVLNEQNNGGYLFSKIEWLRDGVVLPGENDPYIYLPHELWTNTEHQYQRSLYQARLTRADDGKAILTCALEPWHIDNTNVLYEPYVDVRPTVVSTENPVVHVMTNTSGTYWVYTSNGVLLQTADYELCEHNDFEIQLLGQQDMYVLVFTPSDTKRPLKDKYRVVKVVVE